MDLRSLNTFIQVAESGSFTRAGEKLGYAQPTVSVQIRQLEQELGVRLFDRIGHTVRLTDKGHNILLHAQRVCHLCREMTQSGEPEQQAKGLIRLGMASSLCSALISKGFARFRKHYPHISINIVTAGTTELFRLLDHNEVDMVCTLDSHIYNTNYVIANEEKIGVHFVLPPGSPLAQAEQLSLQAICGESFLLTEKDMSYRRLLDEWLAGASMEITPILEIGSPHLICELVERGVGMSFLPDFVTRDAVRSGRVLLKEARGFEPRLWKQLLYHRDKWVSPPMQAVIDYLSGILLDETPCTKTENDADIPAVL